MNVRWLGRLVDPRWRDEILGDLEDEYQERMAAGAGRTWSAVRLGISILVAGAASRWHGRGRVHGGGGMSHGSGRGGMGTSARGLEEIVQDVRFAVRSLRRAPLFTGVALVMLGAGMGLTVSIFAVVHGVLLRPLEYPEPDRLVLLQGRPGARRALPMPLHVLFRDELPGLEEAAAWQGWGPVIPDAGGAPVRLAGASVGAGFFSLAGVAPAAGRLFEARDGAPGHEPAVVLSHDLWTRRFGADPAVVGDVLELDGEGHRIVGVAPAGFVDPVARGQGWSSPEIWRADPPLFREAETDEGWVGFWSLGRLQSGIAAAELTGAMQGLIATRYPDVEAERYAASFRAVTVKDAVVEEVRPTLLVLLLAVGLVLLIACANLANLLLSRGAVRRVELGIRTSLGAGRGRLVRQLVTESVVLALAGSVLGLLLALLGTRVLVGLAGPTLPRAGDVAVDGTVLLFAILAGLGTSLLFGTVPALRASADGVARAAGRGVVGRPGRRAGLQKSLVVVQTAMAMVLLSGAGLLLGSFLRLGSVDPGFDPKPVLAVSLGLQPERFPEPDLQGEALRSAEAALAALPGVDVAGSITDLPLSGAVNSTRIRRPGEPEELAAERRNVLVRAVTPGYFEAMGVRVVRGRAVAPEDRHGAEEVAVVNETFLGEFAPGMDLLGEAVVVRGVERRIVGVVADVREFDLVSRESDPVLYTPYDQEREAWMRSRTNLVVRAGGDPAALVAAVRSAIVEADSRILVGSVRPLEALLEAHLRAPRFRATLVVLFAGLAVVLAAVGLGGVVAYNVARRVPEIGLRRALGAGSPEVLALMLREVATLAIAGVLVGLAAAVLSAPVLSGFLFQVEPRDPWVLGGAAAFLLIVGLAAGWIPARGALRVEPVRALRGE